MSSGHPSSGSSNRKCRWCSKPINDRGKVFTCAHHICNECLSIDKANQTNCLYCEYLHAEQYVQDNRICSSKCKNKMQIHDHICERVFQEE